MHRYDFLKTSSFLHSVFYLFCNPWGIDSQNEMFRLKETNRIIQQFFGRLDLIIELGCGEGHQSNYLKDLADHLVGIETSSIALARASRRYPQLTFLRHDLNEEFPDLIPRKGNNLVVASEVLYYLKDPALLLDLIRERKAHILFSVFQDQHDQLLSSFHHFQINGFKKIEIQKNSAVWHIYLFKQSNGASAPCNENRTTEKIY